MQPIIWQALKWPATEFCTLQDHAQGMLASGRINGVYEQQPFSVHYAIEITADWRVSSFHIRQEGIHYTELKLTSDLHGHWFDKDNNHIAAFDHCIDIDISLTPFTNTLPIKRESFEEGESKVLDMLYISLPAFELQKVQQRYTRVGRHEYLYENIVTDFSANIPFDHQGIVQDYPGLFKRIYY